MYKGPPHDIDKDLEGLYAELRLLDQARPYCVRLAEMLALDVVGCERHLAELAADTSWWAMFKNRRKVLYKTAMRDVLRRLLTVMETTVGDRDRLIREIAKKETIRQRAREDNPPVESSGS